MARLGDGLRKPGTPRPRYDYLDRPHDYAELWDEADVRELKQKVSEGLTVAEVADWLGRTPAGVASKIHRLRAGGLW